MVLSLQHIFLNIFPYPEEKNTIHLNAHLGQETAIGEREGEFYLMYTKLQRNLYS